MVKSYQTELDIEKIKAELAQLDYKEDGSGAQMFVPQSKGIPQALRAFPWTMIALNELSEFRSQPVLNVMVNKLPAKVSVPTHRDFLLPSRQGIYPRVERWHLPIVTNPQAMYSDEKESHVHMAVGYWWGTVPYWLHHCVWNDGEEERVHLVVDLDNLEPQGEYEDCEILSKLQQGTYAYYKRNTSPA